MSKTMSLWEYINYFDTQTNLNFKQKINLGKLPRNCISSKKFINIYMDEIDIKILKNVYNNYFEYVMN